MNIGDVVTEVIIIGTGIGGLSAAKTYLELEPTADVLLLEQRQTVGGVWAEENCYDGLRTNNLRGTYEFTDFPLDDSYGVKEGGHIPGTVVHRYLSDFAAHFNLTRRIKFGTRVLEVEKTDDVYWKISTESTAADTTVRHGVFTCRKLIICSGLASKPNIFRIPGQESFGKPVLNHGQLRVEAHAIAEDPQVPSVTVVGASKTGYDTVQLMASHGKKVNWIIRESGGGAVWMSTAWVPVGPTKVMLEHLATMRFMSWFSPCIWGDFDGFSWIRKFLHGTWIGRTLVHSLWDKIRWNTVKGNGYRDKEVLKHLEPDESLFWTARVGVLNYPGDIHDYLLSGQVEITRKDISRLSEKGTVHFADDSSLQTDALIAITGWSLVPSIKYKPDGIDASLGIPSSTLRDEEKAFWKHLEQEADEEILGRFPYLASPPKRLIPYTQKVSPFRLYRGMAPPGLTARSDHSLVFMKMVHSTSNFVIAETQALWAYAYLNNKIPIKTGDVYRQTALISRYGKLRYPCGFSSWYPEFVYDVIPYADMLLGDLGVNHRRKKTWRQEVFEGYTVHDYKGINREWMMLNCNNEK